MRRIEKKKMKYRIKKLYKNKRSFIVQFGSYNLANSQALDSIIKLALSKCARGVSQ